MKNLLKAMLAAQKSMGAATKGATNPYFKSKYADYGAVLEAVKGPLNDNGIVIMQPHISKEGKNFVMTVLAHADSGETFESFTEVVCAKPNDPQAFGSAVTYARRYGLQSLPCLPTDDDDGNAAANKTNTAISTSPDKSGNEELSTGVKTSTFRRVGTPKSRSMPTPSVGEDF